MIRMKDDERRLLARVAKGAYLDDSDLPLGRLTQLIRKWQRLGWLEGKELTSRGRIVASKYASQDFAPDEADTEIYTEPPNQFWERV